MENKKAQISLMVWLIIGVIAVVLALVLGIGFIVSNTFKLYAIGTAIILVSLIYGFKGGLDKNKSMVMIVAIIIGAGFIIFPSLGLTQTALPEGLSTTTYTTSGIDCTVVADCPQYLLDNNVTQENIEKVDFKCENSKCLFKLKPGVIP